MSLALPYHVALVSESDSVSFREVVDVAAALQKQVIRDFQPIWHKAAVVTAYTKPPDDAWPIRIVDDVGELGALGFHADELHQPYALVQAGADWSVTASHELLEMLADPWGRRLWKAANPSVAGRVWFLIEVCDPCEAERYEIDGIAVSDFATPAFYHSVHSARPLDLLGRLVVPRAVNQGGYISWVDSDGAWWQETWFGSGTSIRSLGRLADFAQPGESLRGAIDRVTAAARRAES